MEQGFLLEYHLRGPTLRKLPRRRSCKEQTGLTGEGPTAATMPT